MFFNTISDPPELPSIVGYTEGTPIETATSQDITCVSRGGNPLPTLKWFRKDKEVRHVRFSFFTF